MFFFHEVVYLMAYRNLCIYRQIKMTGCALVATSVFVVLLYHDLTTTGSRVKVWRLLNVFKPPPIVCRGYVIVFVLLSICVLSVFVIILKRKRELVALLLLSYGCLITVNVL